MSHSRESENYAIKKPSWHVNRNIIISSLNTQENEGREVLACLIKMSQQRELLSCRWSCCRWMKIIISSFNSAKICAKRVENCTRLWKKNQWTFSSIVSRLKQNSPTFYDVLKTLIEINTRVAVSSWKTHLMLLLLWARFDVDCEINWIMLNLIRCLKRKLKYNKHELRGNF